MSFFGETKEVEEFLKLDEYKLDAEVEMKTGKILKFLQKTGNIYQSTVKKQNFLEHFQY